MESAPTLNTHPSLETKKCGQRRHSTPSSTDLYIRRGSLQRVPLSAQLLRAFRAYCEPKRHRPILGTRLVPVSEEPLHSRSDEGGEAPPAQGQQQQGAMLSTITILLQLAFLEVAVFVENEVLAPFKEYLRGDEDGAARLSSPRNYNDVESAGVPSEKALGTEAIPRRAKEVEKWESSNNSSPI